MVYTVLVIQVIQVSEDSSQQLQHVTVTELSTDEFGCVTCA